jgi:hypothetical protein
MRVHDNMGRRRGRAQALDHPVSFALSAREGAE